VADDTGMTGAQDPSRAGRTAAFVRRARRASVIPALAVLLGLLAGAVVIILANALAGRGWNLLLPIEAYASMLQGALGSVDGVIRTLAEATPLILAGLAVAVGFKAGLFNIGANGQFLIGALAAAAVGSAVADLSPILAIPLALGAGMLFSAFYGFIPGALKAWTGAHEVVTTIMLNFIAAATVAFMVTGPLEAPGFSFARTGDVGNAAYPAIGDTAAHLGILIAFLAVPVIYWLLNRSVFGFEIRMVGANPSAARYAGIRAGRVVILTMSLSAMLAGMAGAGQVLGLTHFISASFSTTAGFDAITIALLGRVHPFGVLLASLLFGIMRAGSGLMQIQVRVPVEIIDLIQAMILLFLTADIIVRWIFRIRAERAELAELKTITKTYGQATR
jgi:general nucleoside transport system permease protein